MIKLKHHSSVKLSFRLQLHFFFLSQRKTLCKADILQLSHLGLSVVNKLRYLRNEVNESIDDHFMLYQSIIYETEMMITEWLKESSMPTLCNTDEARFLEQRISTALGICFL